MRILDCIISPLKWQRQKLRRQSQAPNVKSIIWRSLAGMLLISVLVGCADLQQYRTEHVPCDSSKASNNCERASIEQTPEYLLAFVEFDDEGWFWDRRQLTNLLHSLSHELSTNGLIMMVFVHGWHHNASFQDENVSTFKTLLKEMSKTETLLSATEGRPPRRIAGVYVGWRGLSQRLAGIQHLTFWRRKQIARTVGKGGVTELLLSLEQLQRQAQSREHEGARTGLIISGHSFGAAVVYSAVAPFLLEGMLHSGRTQSLRGIEGVGDLVILLNPAFEAAAFTTLRAVEQQMLLPTIQKPKMLVFNSEADDATKYAFPAGQWLAKATFNRFGIAPGSASLLSIGHFEPFVTHDLAVATNAVGLFPDSVATIIVLKDRCTSQKTLFESETLFSRGTLVSRTMNGSSSPFVFVKVGERLLPSHGFDAPDFLHVLREVIFLSLDSKVKNDSADSRSKSQR